MNELFAKDFIALQSEITTMPKDKSGYGYKYTDLDTIISNLKPLCKKHNIGFIQLLHTDTEGRTGIDTLIIHSTGDQLNSFVVIPEIQVGKANNAQNVGAAITYFKRYALAAAFGISSDEDIDCSTQAMENHNKKGVTSVTPNKSNSAPTEKALNTKSDEKPQNNRKFKYTAVQMQKLAEVVTARFENGADIFTEEEKATYRKMLTDGKGDEAYHKAFGLLQQRTGAPVPSDAEIESELQA